MERETPLTCLKRISIVDLYILSKFSTIKHNIPLVWMISTKIAAQVAPENKTVNVNCVGILKNNWKLTITN